MAKAKVKIDVYMSKNIPGKIEYARDRVIDMTGNPNFTTPNPALLIISNAADDLETKYNAAQGGGPSDTEAQDAAELVLDDLMHKEAAYVDTVADGNTVVITSGGWTPTKTEKVPLLPPLKATGTSLTQTPQSGTIISNCNPVANAKGFVTILSLTENPAITIDGNQIVVAPSAQPVIIHVGSKRKATHTNLTPATKYYMRKYAFNTAGRAPDSDVISIMVV
ncbi:MAG TPA: hypothetical protein VI757_13985 [Bacteroidia bacterium]|nr:hypothetical protein [Bacteroidia bacterium]